MDQKELETMPEELTTAQAAKYLKVNARTLIRWVQIGRIKPVEMPEETAYVRLPTYRFKREEVLKLKPQPPPS